MDTNEMIKLTCETRTSVGKQNRSLRKNGKIPAVIYGEGMKPLSVAVSEKDFSLAFKKAGETSIIECEIEGQKIPTLISDVSIHPVLNTFLHIDFRKVNLKKKVTVDVPVELIGESPAVKSAGGVLLQQMNEIKVEALPQSIPSKIQIDISILSEIGKEIKIKDIAKSENYAVLEDGERVVVSVIAHKEESTETQAERAEVEITTEKKEGEGEEGEGEETPSVAKPENTQKVS